MEKATILASKLSEIYNDTQLPELKKKKGQFFTTKSIADFMASLVIIDKNELSILDPGSGTGVLVAALVDRIISEDIKITLNVDLFETDENIISALEEVMNYCKLLMETNGNKFNYNIINKDFIMYHSEIFNLDLFSQNYEYKLYDCVISNPPYFKVPINHQYSELLHEYVHGQPNIYFMFMAVSENLLLEDGQLIFIVPRSFTSGSYFKKFRNKFLEKISINHIHLFNSRKDNFNKEKVLQENLILVGKNNSDRLKNVIISSSNNSDIKKDYDHINISYSDMISSTSEEKIIRIPTTNEQYAILKDFDKWTNNIVDMDLNISTGRIVSFRNKEFISEYNKKDTYPLICMKNLKVPNVIFPINETDKGISKDCNQSLLVPSKNYLLLKRFTSKEQKKRIECSIYDSDKQVRHDFIGIENHVNYMYKNKGELTQEEMYGLSIILNSNHADMYFRIVNGNTQVNAPILVFGT